MKNITSSLKLTETCRKGFMKYLDGFDLDALNYIPKKFNNNLIWNIGHILATEQLLIYRLSNVPTKMGQTLINKYKKGTKPQERVSQGEIDEIRGMLLTQIDQLAEDYDNGLFTNFKPYSTSLGLTLENVNDVIEFNILHEGMHLGSCLAIKKFLV